MNTEKKTLRVIQKVLVLDKTPEPEDNFFDDLNTHHEELESLRAKLNIEFEIEITEEDFKNVLEVKDVIKIVKDCTDDIS